VLDGTSRVANLRYISVWVKGTKGWQTVAFQATSILFVDRGSADIET